jgi:hypothetical protein
MTRSELRIGNIIDRGDYHCKVTSITEDGIMTEPINYEGERFVEQTTKPIPITEEWLVKLGFVRDKTEIAVYYFGDLEIQLPVYFKYKESHIHNIKYVHELQNLYFALTGKELEI